MVTEVDADADTGPGSGAHRLPQQCGEVRKDRLASMSHFDFPHSQLLSLVRHDDGIGMQWTLGSTLSSDRSSRVSFVRKGCRCHLESRARSMKRIQGKEQKRAKKSLQQHKAREVQHETSPTIKSQTVSLENRYARHNGDEAEKSSTARKADGHGGV